MRIDKVKRALEWKAQKELQSTLAAHSAQLQLQQNELQEKQKAQEDAIVAKLQLAEENRLQSQRDADYKSQQERDELLARVKAHEDQVAAKLAEHAQQERDESRRKRAIREAAKEEAIQLALLKRQNELDAINQLKQEESRLRMMKAQQLEDERISNEEKVQEQQKHQSQQEQQQKIDQPLQRHMNESQSHQAQQQLRLLKAKQAEDELMKLELKHAQSSDSERAALQQAQDAAKTAIHRQRLSRSTSVKTPNKPHSASSTKANSRGNNSRPEWQS